MLSLTYSFPTLRLLHCLSIVKLVGLYPSPMRFPIFFAACINFFFVVCNEQYFEMMTCSRLKKPVHTFFTAQNQDHFSIYLTFKGIIAHYCTLNGIRRG
ncbi:Uncharacterised protein [Mycobacterium tuberculosis]|nr:Uncharacterised protein [Mycobacterium tuberculosis]